jgi:uncharacterized protein
MDFFGLQDGQSLLTMHKAKVFSMAASQFVLVTGASSGIGRDLAVEYARAGHPLVITARRKERLDELAGQLRSRYGVPVDVIAADLQEKDAPQLLMEKVREKGIVLHTLVNNAGFGLRGRFATLPFDEQMNMLMVNIHALTALSRLVLPDLIARRAGGILNVCSTAAFQAGPNMAVYYASKAYVLSFSEALYEEARPYGVKITAFCPGPVNTEFAARADLEGSRLFRFGAMESAAAAQAAFKGHLSGRVAIVPGFMNKVTWLGAGILPRFVTRRIAGRLQNV